MRIVQSIVTRGQGYPRSKGRVCECARGSALLGLVLLVALGLAACSPRGVDSPKPSREAVVPVTVTSVKFIEMDRAIPVVGTLFAKDEAIISAEVEGQVEKTMAEFGDRVAAGQEIAQIDTTTYEALSRQAAANLARAKATTANAEHNLNRVQDLQTNNIASASDFDKGLRRS